MKSILFALVVSLAATANATPIQSDPWQVNTPYRLHVNTHPVTGQWTSDAVTFGMLDDRKITLPDTFTITWPEQTDVYIVEGLTFSLTFAEHSVDFVGYSDVAVDLEYFYHSGQYFFENPDQDHFFDPIERRREVPVSWTLSSEGVTLASDDFLWPIYVFGPAIAYATLDDTEVVGLLMRGGGFDALYQTDYRHNQAGQYVGYRVPEPATWLLVLGAVPCWFSRRFSR